jgi:hypothetical protein
MVSSCWFSWLTTRPKVKTSSSSGSASSRSSALSRTVEQYDRASVGGSSGNSTRLARGLAKAS